jgi:hypothetical protein
VSEISATAIHRHPLFVFLGLLQGLLTSDLGGMVRRVALDLPLAILGMVASTVVVGRLITGTHTSARACVVPAICSLRGLHPRFLP